MAIYPYGYVYMKQKTILLWETSADQDTFMLDSDGHLIQSRSINGLKKKLLEKKINVLWNEYSEISFDKFWTALSNLRENRASSKKTCKNLLDGWNFIEIMGLTFKLSSEMKKLKSKTLSKAYEKLFYGNNLPAVTPEGKSYSPLWTKREMKALRKDLKNIWQLFITNGYIN